METAKLWLMLLCVCGSWILSLANCDWTTEYKNGNKCCKACPSGKSMILFSTLEGTLSILSNAKIQVTALLAHINTQVSFKHCIADHWHLRHHWWSALEKVNVCYTEVKCENILTWFEYHSLLYFTGQYPKVKCSANKSDSECEKCSTASSAMDKCFCNDNHLCSDDECTSCEPRIKCKPGNQLNRYGKVFLLLLLNVMTRVHYDCYLWVLPHICGSFHGDFLWSKCVEGMTGLRDINVVKIQFEILFFRLLFWQVSLIILTSVCHVQTTLTMMLRTAHVNPLQSKALCLLHFIGILKKRKPWDFLLDNNRFSDIRCAGGEIFPGNKTYNARCGSTGLYFYCWHVQHLLSWGSYACWPWISIHIPYL